MNRRRFVQLIGATALVSVAPIKAKAYRWGPPDDGQPPRKWLLCDGRYLDRKDYPDLFNMIGNKFGGYTEYWIQGIGIPAKFVRETFRLPDLRAKVEITQPIWAKEPQTATFNHMIKAIPDNSVRDDPWFGTIVMYSGSEDRINSLL